MLTLASCGAAQPICPTNKREIGSGVMLVLSRRINQSIIVGDSIEITVRRVSRGRVVLGLKAPDDVTIVRGELDRLPSEESNSGSASVPPRDRSVEACAR